MIHEKINEKHAVYGLKVEGDASLLTKGGGSTWSEGPLQAYYNDDSF